MTYRNGGGWKQVLGIAGLSAALAMGVAVYSGRLGESPEATFERNAIPHRCLDLECDLCNAEMRWLERNPGRELGDIVGAAEQGVPIRLTPTLPLGEED
jgi:hypothetical protein